MRRTLFFVALLAGRLAVAAEAAPLGSSLTITLWPHGKNAAARTWTLRCGPAAGTHPTRTSAQARITGTWNGRQVDRSYRIGCPGWRDLRVTLTGR